MKFTAITQTKHEGDNSIMREGYTSQAKKHWHMRLGQLKNVDIIT